MRAMALRSSRRSDTTEEKEERPGRIDRTLAYLANKLPEMSSITATDGWLAYAGAAHIAIFYLGGRYYGVAQRLAGVEYVSALSLSYPEVPAVSHLSPIPFHSPDLYDTSSTWCQTSFLRSSRGSASNSIDSQIWNGSQ